MANLEKTLKALANKRRIAILRFLKKKKSAKVGEISEVIKLSFKSTSRHLAVLYGAELVEKEQISLEVFYSLSRKSKSHPIVKYVANSHEQENGFK